MLKLTPHNIVLNFKIKQILKAIFCIFNLNKVNFRIERFMVRISLYKLKAFSNNEVKALLCWHQFLFRDHISEKRIIKSARKAL